MEKGKLIRIFLTAVILLISGYYVQMSSHELAGKQDIIKEVKADVPVGK